MEMLFIGGPADGQWRDVDPERREITVFVPDPKTADKVLADTEALSTDKIAVKHQALYVRHPLSQGAGKPWLYVFALAGEELNVISLLIEGYKPYMSRKK